MRIWHFARKSETTALFRGRIMKWTFQDNILIRFFVAGGFRHDQRRFLSAPRVETNQHEEGRGSVLSCSTL